MISSTIWMVWLHWLLLANHYKHHNTNESRRNLQIWEGNQVINFFLSNVCLTESRWIHQKLWQWPIESIAFTLENSFSSLLHVAFVPNGASVDDCFCHNRRSGRLPVLRRLDPKNFFTIIKLNFSHCKNTRS